MLDDPLLTETPSPEELELAQRLLADRSPETIASALIRLYRSRLPEPEELSEDIRPAPGAYEPREPRQPREPYARASDAFGGGDMDWFRLSIGRRANADPKWLIPLICRMGHVTKKDIGAIRTFDHETKFDIARERSAAFGEAVYEAREWPRERAVVEVLGEMEALPAMASDGTRSVPTTINAPGGSRGC